MPPKSLNPNAPVFVPEEQKQEELVGKSLMNEINNKGGKSRRRRRSKKTKRTRTRRHR